MKTLEQIVNYKGGKSCNFLDGRDRLWLSRFVPKDMWDKIGVTANEGIDWSEPLTEANVRRQLATDLEFAFDKALGCRGLSASLMYDVIKMWMWVLDDALAEESDNDYTHYGLPFLKAVAVKYGLPNPIGDKQGNEDEFSGRA